MSNDVVVPGNNLPAAWQDRMAQHAKEGLANERTSGSMFSTKSGILTFGGIQVPNNKMQVVVVAAMFENVWYGGLPYDANNPMSPSCYAFSFDGKDMAPHTEAEKPQSPLCGSCKWNQWDSGPNNKGKACKEQRRLALLPAGSLATPDDIAKGTVGYLRIPVTSTKAFSEYVKHVGMMGLPMFAVITEVQLAPHPKHMWAFSFSNVAVINDTAALEALEKRHYGEKQTMSFPYQKNATPAQPGQQGAAPAPGKF